MLSNVPRFEELTGCNFCTGLIWPWKLKTLSLQFRIIFLPQLKLSSSFLQCVEDIGPSGCKQHLMFVFSQNLITTCYFLKKKGILNYGMKHFWWKYFDGLKQNLDTIWAQSIKKAMLDIRLMVVLLLSGIILNNLSMIKARYESFSIH